MGKEVNLNDERVRKMLILLLWKGPLNQYQIEKETGLKHSTMMGLFKPMIREGYVDLASKERFKTGLDKRYYRISPAGFLWLLHERKKKYDDPDLEQAEVRAWDQIADIVQNNPELSPWLSDQLILLREAGVPRLFGYLVEVYFGSMTHMLLSGAPLPDPNSEFRQGGERRVREMLAAFFLRVLYPKADLEFSGFHTHPGSWSEVTSDSATLQMVQGQIKTYLRANRNFAKFILGRLAEAEAQLDMARSGIEETKKDFGTLMGLKGKVHSPSG